MNHRHLEQTHQNQRYNLMSQNRFENFAVSDITR